MRYLDSEGYQWLPDGRVLVWIANTTQTHWRALLVDTKTGKQEFLPLFNALYDKGRPGTSGAIAGSYVSPDGKFLGSFLSPFKKAIQFFRSLSFAGYDLHLQRIREEHDGSFYFTPYLAWEWSASYHGWVQISRYNNDRTALVDAVVHFDLDHPEKPKIVELAPKSLPDWISD